MIVGTGCDLGVTTLNLRDPTLVAAADAYVLARADGTAFHRPAWLAAVEQGTGNRAHMLAAVSPAGRIAGLLPITHVRSRLFGQALVSSAFAVDGGVLADDAAIAAMLVRSARRLADDLGGLSIELRGGATPGDGWRSDGDSYLGFMRVLAADDEAELLAVPRKHRAEVRKALANPALTVEVGGAELLRDHYHVYATSVRNLGTPVFPAALFRAVLTRFAPDADIIIVRHDGRPVSAVLTLYHRGMVMPFWGGGLSEARGLRANELMYYRLMRHGRARGMTHFDFGRSKAGTGQAAWKKSWGFDPVPLIYHHFGPDQRDINPTNPKYQRRIALWKRLPLPVANLIGPLIARGLG
ncbi:FemAB family XrtA/PEP-CTERM system-associated protein [Sphingobium sp. AN641]|uniref:FemAB family XrtA/PEP-CTERM system-associated protein n=1 Tax=Sphingobium sp. AN641 TaxID=3133443 RepID=UPI0030C4E72E